jgi:hypothetical protein
MADDVHAAIRHLEAVTRRGHHHVLSSGATLRDRAIRDNPMAPRVECRSRRPAFDCGSRFRLTGS